MPQMTLQMTLQAAHPAPALQKALSQKFRADQAKVGETASKAVARVWNGNFLIKEARASWRDMRPAVVMICQKFYAASQASAAVYYDSCRISAGLGPMPVKVKVPSLPLTRDHVGNVIDPCGLGAFLHAVKTGARMMDAFNSGRDSLSAAVATLVMSGARDWLEAAAKADPKSDGVRRVVGGTCDYCEGLAGEGAMADQNWHNDCQCTSEPVFNGDTGPSMSSPESDVTAAPASDAAEVTSEADNANPMVTKVDDMSSLPPDSPVPSGIGPILDKWVQAGGSDSLDDSERKSLVQAVRNYGGNISEHLMRGESDQPDIRYAVGKNINLSPASFSTELESALPYAEAGSNPTVIHILPQGNQAVTSLKVGRRAARQAGYYEQEHIVAKRLQVLKSAVSDGIRHVYVGPSGGKS